MEEARPRFNESASMILKALETGFIEGGGPFYPQNRTAIHPAPSRSFANHFYGVAMSPNTVPIVAGLGTTMMSFLQFDIESHMPEIENYRAEFEQAHKRVAPPPVIIDVTFCDNDAGRAEEMARRYVADYYLSRPHTLRVSSTITIAAPRAMRTTPRPLTSSRQRAGTITA